MSNSISQAVLKQRKQPHMTSLQACTRLVAMVTVLCVIILTLPLPEAKWAAECVTVCVCTSMCVCVCVQTGGCGLPFRRPTVFFFSINTGW